MSYLGGVLHDQVVQGLEARRDLVAAGAGALRRHEVRVRVEPLQVGHAAAVVLGARQVACHRHVPERKNKLMNWHVV